MDIKELKRELSKVSGIDFFSPKYRAIFKKFGGEEKDIETEEAEEAKTTEAVTEEAVVTKDNKITEDNTEETDTAETEAEETELTEEIEETTEAESSAQAEAEPKVATEEEAAQPAADAGDELLAIKLELELVRAGIREDRLETAKRLFMSEYKSSGGNTQQLKELIAQYPEWVGKQGGAQGFGMPLGDKADALTNEEKALKRMGINPRE